MSGEDPVYTVTVDNPTLPKGEPIQIVGLGTFENGGTYTVSKQEADAYRTYHSALVTTRDERDGSILGADTELGPTLLQASKTMFGVEVSTADSKERRKGQSNTIGDDDTSKMVAQVSDDKVENPKTDTGSTKTTGDKEVTK